MNRNKVLKEALNKWKYFPIYTPIHQIGRKIDNSNQIDLNSGLCGFSIDDEWFSFHNIIAQTKHHYAKHETHLFVKEILKFVLEKDLVEHYTKKYESFKKLPEKEQIAEYCNWIKYYYMMQDAYSKIVDLIKKKFFNLSPIVEIIKILTSNEILNKCNIEEDNIRKILKNIIKSKNDLSKAKNFEKVNNALVSFSLSLLIIDELSNEVNDLKENFKLLDEVTFNIDKLIDLWENIQSLNERFQSITDKDCQ